MFIVLGIGNPDEKYADTRHNVGWMTVDALSETIGKKFRKSGFEFWAAEGAPGTARGGPREDLDLRERDRPGDPGAPEALGRGDDGRLRRRQPPAGHGADSEGRVERRATTA
jgi:hypothetical protein